jgi:hypothetical protein
LIIKPRVLDPWFRTKYRIQKGEVIGGAATSTGLLGIVGGKAQAKSWKGLKEKWAAYEPDKVKGEERCCELDSGKKHWGGAGESRTRSERCRKVEGLMAEPSEVKGGKSGENGMRKCGYGGEGVQEDKVNKGMWEERTWRAIHPSGGACRIAMTCAYLAVVARG